MTGSATRKQIMARAKEHPRCELCQHLAHIVSHVSVKGCRLCEGDALR